MCIRMTMPAKRQSSGIRQGPQARQDLLGSAVGDAVNPKTHHSTGHSPPGVSSRTSHAGLAANAIVWSSRHWASMVTVTVDDSLTVIAAI